MGFVSPFHFIEQSFANKKLSAKHIDLVHVPRDTAARYVSMARLPDLITLKVFPLMLTEFL